VPLADFLVESHAMQASPRSLLVFIESVLRNSMRSCKANQNDGQKRWQLVIELVDFLRFENRRTQ